MNCIETRRYVDLLQDNQLEVEKNLEVLKHLNLCPTCTDIFETERRLRETMKASHDSESASEELRRRIRGALVQGRHWRWVRPLAAAVLVGITSLLVWGTFVHPGRVEAAVLVDAAVAQHAALPSEVIQVSGENDSEARVSLETWFRERGVCVCLHDLGPAGYAFRAGAVIGNFPAKGKFSWTLQQTPDGRRLSHLTVPEGLVKVSGGRVMSVGGMEARLFERGSRTVILLRRPGTVCFFVTESAREADNVMAALMR